MDAHHEIREFLTSRRARISPQRVGLAAEGGKRRVPGLRREEVALLAGVSVDYYTRLERGHAAGVSDTVLEALATALQLDDAERAHLLHLVQATKNATRPRPLPPTRPVRPTVQYLLDAITGAPALLRNACMDILGANRLGMALHATLFADPARPVNHARFFFLDPYAMEFYVDWDRHADRAVALLRAEAGRDPNDRALSDLVDELAMRSEPFRSRWDAHDVSFYEVSTRVRFRHPVVGELTLTFEALPVTGAPGVWMIVHVAEPGSASEEALAVLADWATLNGK